MCIAFYNIFIGFIVIQGFCGLVKFSGIFYFFSWPWKFLSSNNYSNFFFSLLGGVSKISLEILSNSGPKIFGPHIIEISLAVLAK